MNPHYLRKLGGGLMCEEKTKWEQHDHKRGEKTMVERRKPIPVEEAIERVMKFAKKGEVEKMPLAKAYGRHLGEAVLATHDVPPFNKSPYDGFAIRAQDSREANLQNPVEFHVVEEIGAGTVAKRDLGPFEAIRIMTGAQMPVGGDAVVMLELTKEFEKNGEKYISIKRSFQEGDNISFQGEDAAKGTTLVEKGTKITPGVTALLATFGYAEVAVAKKPNVGVYSTGTELLDVSQKLEPGKIRNSNGPMICAQIERSGGVPLYFGSLVDDFDQCYQAVKEALEKVDVLITTGGVSVGDYDYLPAIYEKLGAEVLFNKVAMRPGSVTTVAQLDGKLLFGLSGNPSACYVGFELFVHPILKTFLGSEKPHKEIVHATLMADFPKPNPFTRFVRTRITQKGGRFVVEPSGLDKSNVVSSLAFANGLMKLPGGTRGFASGDQVDVILLEDYHGVY